MAGFGLPDERDGQLASFEQVSCEHERLLLRAARRRALLEATCFQCDKCFLLARVWKY